MSDIEKAFNFLHDGVPQWFKNVAEIEKKIMAMQDELAKVPMAERTMMKKRKSESIESLRDVDADMEDAPQHSVADQASPLASRKRKTPSVSSEHATTAVKIKARSMVVVSYDGQLQNSFEQLVRAIGTGRNMLRKGKMAAKMEAMAALAAEDDDDEGSDDDNAVLAKIGYRHRTGLASMRTRAAMPRTTPTGSSGTPVELFDTVDKSLENAQSLCEKAAHLSLREGDCRKELSTVRQHFTEVQEAAAKEVVRIAAKKEKEAQECPQADPEKPKVGVAPTLPLEQKRLLPVGLPPTTSPTHIVAQVIDIEVDDDDEDDTNFVMPPIRLTSRG